MTVSIAALDACGTFSRMLRVKRVEMSTWAGEHVECWGTSRTSSKVKAVAKPASDGVRVNAPVLSSMGSSMSGARAVALLVLLATAARAWVVASDFGFLAPNGFTIVVAAGIARGGVAWRRRTADDWPAWLRAAAKAGTEGSARRVASKKS